jgi:hypothetical protein
MPDFDPKQYAAEAAAQTFDPKAYAASAKKESATPQMDFLVDTAKMVGSGVKAFFTDPRSSIGENVPLVGPLARRAGEAVFGSFMEGGAEGLRARRDAEKRAFAEEHPGADIAQKLVGGIGGGLALPAPGAGMGGVAGAATRIGSNVGILGGDALARTGSLDEAKRAATSGGMLQLGMESIPVVGKAASPLARAIAQKTTQAGEKLQQTGAMRAVKAALGNNAKAWRMMGTKAQDTGEQMLEKGVVTFGAKAGKIAGKADDAADDAWAKVTQTFDDADNAGVTVNGADIAQKIRDEAAKIERVPQNEARIASLEKEALFFESQGAMPLSRVQKLKGEYDFKPTDAKNAVLGKDGNNLMNRVLGNSVKDTVKASNLPGAAEFERAYTNAGAFGAVKKAANQTEQQLTKNRSPFSLTDYIAGGAAGVGATVLGGDYKDAGLASFAIATANNLARTRGNSALAVTMNKLGQAIERKPDQVARFYGVLEKAAQNGQSSLVAAHQMLLQTEPEYRKAIEQQPEGPGEGVTIPLANPDESTPIKRRIQRLGE